MRPIRTRATVPGLALLAVAVPFAATGTVHAVPVQVTGGTATLALPPGNSRVVPITLIDTSPEITRIGDSTTQTLLGFPVNPNTAPDRPTTATLDTADPAGTFAGSIEMLEVATFLLPGPSVLVHLGDFSLAFDPARAGTLDGQASGFFLRDNDPGDPAVPFDIATGFQFSSTTTSLTFSGTLLTAPDLNARYQADRFPTSVLGLPFGTIQLAATVQPAPLPLPPAFYPALATLAGLSLIPFIRRHLRRPR